MMWLIELKSPVGPLFGPAVGGTGGNAFVPPAVPPPLVPPLTPEVLALFDPLRARHPQSQRQRIVVAANSPSDFADFLFVQFMMKFGVLLRPGSCVLSNFIGLTHSYQIGNHRRNLERQLVAGRQYRFGLGLL